MSDAAQTFNEAYDLIEQGNLTAARQLLNNVRAENLNNPHFWWLYAHAVEDEREGRDALQRVKELQPDYPGIDNLLQQTNIGTPAPRPIQTIRPPQTLPDLPKTQGIDDDFDMGDDDFVLDERPQGNTRRNLFITAAVVIVLLILGAFLLPNLLGGMKPTSTPIAQPVTTLGTLEIIDTTEDVTTATEESTATEEAVETEEATPTEAEVEPTEKPTATEEEATPTEEIEPTEDIPTTKEATEIVGDFAVLAAQLADFDVPADGVQVGETLLGNTLLVTTCSAPGPATTEAILGIANALKEETLGDDIEAVGFSITNCSDDTVLRIIGVSRSDFDDFIADNITIQQLQGLLRPIG